MAPIDFSRFVRAPLRDAAGRRIRRILLGTNRYDLTTWWKAKGYGDSDGRLTFPGGGEASIRPGAAVAVGLATSLATGAYHPSRVGVDTPVAWQRTVRLVTSLAAAHRANAGREDTPPDTWGHGWQTALWASYAGLAAWLVWDAVPASDRPLVEGMLVSEADRFLDYDVPYYRNAQGEIVSPGDTKAEENSWNARLLDLASSMLPGHANAERWRQMSLRLFISAYARPEDVTSDAVVHGRPLSQWLDGSNVDERGVLVNHDRIHPDYMVVPHNAAAGLHARLRGERVPAGALHNLDVMYAALVDVTFPSPPYRKPGGTIYRDGSSAIYYPQGSDWGTRRRINFVLNDVEAAVFGFDGRASTPAGVWEQRHVDEVLGMMERFDDGRVYKGPKEFESDQREEEAAEKAGQSYLARWLTSPPVTNRAYHQA